MKSKFMQTTVGALLALLIVVGTTQVYVAGQGKAKDMPETAAGHSTGSIEGVWQTTITLRNCQTGEAIRTARGLSVYHKGGTVSETSAVLPPGLRSAGYGVWTKGKGSKYSSSFIFMRLNPDGSFAGTQKIMSDIDLGGNGNTYATTTSIQIFDVNDSLIGTGYATATATRFE